MAGRWRLAAALAALALAGSLVRAADEPPLTEPELRQRLDEFRAAPDDGARVKRAGEWLAARRFSSLQVKALAQAIADEDARLEFALSAFPRVVDPENFYEVYDAFQTFSKVFRLHDRLAALRRQPPGPPPGGFGPPPLSDSEFADLLKAIRRENFDDGRLAMGRQAFTSARGRISAKQVRDVVKLMSFEDGRLGLAKAGYECVRDPWNYHVVYEAFSFSSSREELARCIEPRTRAAPPRR